MAWLIALHVLGACAAFALGVVALRARPGSRRHRRAGTAYLGAWGVLALMGVLLGRRHAGVSPFEILNTVGVTVVLLGYTPVLVPAARRALAGADGRGWLRWHVRGMVGSMPFLVVAGLNQTLPFLGVPYSMPLLWSTTAVAVVVTATALRRLLRRYRLLPRAEPVAG